MTQDKESTGRSRFGHWLRVVVMCLSGGFIFPHAMTEDDEDPAKDSSKK